MRGFLPPPGIPSYGQGFASCAAESENPELWKGLEGYWDPTLGVTGLTLRNWSPRRQALDGTLMNMDPATDWVPSRYGWALKYTDNDRVVCGNVLSLNNATAASWSFWIRPSRVDYTNQYFCSHNFPTGYGFKQDETKIIAYFGDVAKYAATGAGYISVDTWHHICVVYDGGIPTVRIYIDGLDTNAGINGVIPASLSTGANLFQIGYYAASYYFEGLIGVVATWNRILYVSQIQHLYRDPHALTIPKRLILPSAAAPAAGGPAPHYTRRRMTGGMIAMGN